MTYQTDEDKFNQLYQRHLAITKDEEKAMYEAELEFKEKYGTN